MEGAFLRGLPVFEGIEGARLAELEAAAETRSYVAREKVFEAGDPCDGIYVVARGGVVIRKEVVGEAIERVRDVGPGDMFGEMEALDGSPRLYQARVLGPTRLWRIPPEPLWRFLRQHPLVETRLRTLVIYRRTTRLRALLAPSNRRDPRIRIDRAVLLAQAGVGGGTVVGARLEDLSYGGACLSSAPESWRPGEPAAFTLGTAEAPQLLAVRAQVRWRIQGMVGLVFEGDTTTPAHRRQVDRAVRVLVEGGTVLG